MLPFSKADFFAVFAAYNTAIWPVQAVAGLLGLAVIAAIIWRRPAVVSAILALMWLWTGVAYHWLHFAAINPAARLFAILFIVQAALLALYGLVWRKLDFGPRAGPRDLAGWLFIGYSALVYPAIGQLSGHGYPAMPMFGVTPCPVTIFTLGVLLLASPPAPRALLVIPVLWSVIGGSAAVLLGVPQDWFLLFSGLIAAVLLIRARSTR